MDAKPHYFKIGIFVLLAIALIVTAVILFGGGFLGREMLHFESYFAESITGLNVGSPLEFRGVRIGQVEQIGFVGSFYELDSGSYVISPYAPYVRVVTAVQREKLPDFDVNQLEVALKQMIEKGLRVRVSSNFLTGQAFLEMNYLDPNRFAVEEVPWDPKYLRIPSAPGELTTIKDSIDSILSELQAIDVPGLAGSLENVFSSLDVAISDANLAELSAEAVALMREGRRKLAALEVEKINAATQELLASLNTAVADANVPALSGEAEALLVELRTTNNYLQDLLIPPEGFVERPNLPEILARLGQAISNLNRLVASERPQVEAILAEFREITESLGELIQELREQPSSLLFANPPERSEVLQ
jgi:hypothetical protein